MTIVREVSLLAAGTSGDPLAVTQANYDVALAASPFADSPKAFRVAAFFKAPWKKVLDVAHKRGRAFEQSVAALRRRDPEGISESDACAAVSSVALRLGVSVLRPDAYDVELDKLIEEQRRAWLHGRPIANAFPSSLRIDAKFGWDAIVASAGLAPRPKLPTQAESRNRKWTWTCEQCVGSLITALDLLAASSPSAALTTRAYRRLKQGRSDLAPMSAITNAAAAMGTTFSQLRNDLVAWRLNGRLGEPPALAHARASDVNVEHRRRGRVIERRLNRTWARPLLEALARFGRPVSVSELSKDLDVPVYLVSGRLVALAETGKVEMINSGRNRKTARWQLPAPDGEMAVPTSGSATHAEERKM